MAVVDHAYAQLMSLSDADQDVIANASGTVLLPELYARSGWAALRDADVIPLLVDEIGQLEAAVLNLESYGGHEVALVAGYGLLESFGGRDRNVHPLHRVHGVLAFTGGTADEAATGSATPAPA
ncbi:hypothetical protein ACIPSE_31840 [Streptomyces sp. NPDC090106]|uniref:hypothetical protein n=1 Tax=Streptomyces sp. NPDC090106 TaxID=3365946 RepID=UPI003817E43F